MIGRLVEEQQVRLPDERAREQHTAAPAAGQRSHTTRPARRPRRDEHCIDTLFRCRHSSTSAQCSCTPPSDTTLEHGAWIVAAERPARGGRCAAPGCRQTLPAVGRELAADDPKQRRFAGAVAADDADPLARLDLQAGIVEQRQMSVRDRDAVEGNERHAGRCGARYRVLADGREEHLAEVVGLAGADALHGEQRVDGGRTKPRHLAKRRVMKDHVRRHAARSGDVEPDRAQPLEQRAVDALPRFGFDARSACAARPCAADAAARAPVRDSCTRPSAARVPCRCHAEHRVLVAIQPQQIETDELLDVAANLWRPTPAGSRPNVLSVSWPRPVTCSLAWPRSTLATCIGAESLADSHDARQNLARKHDRLCRGLELVEAVVAGAAAVLGVTIAEVLGRCRWRQPTLEA